MIYTITLNPCLDYIMDLDEFESGIINRSKSELVLPGGKGINVSQILQELGVKNTAVFFSASFTGKYLEQVLKEKNIETKSISIDKGFTRINVKVRSGYETAINAKGPEISDSSLDELFNYLKSIDEGDIIVISGNIPPGLKENIYEEIIANSKKRGAEFVVDATKSALTSVLKHRPFLIKPNHEELGEILDVEINNFEDAIDGSRKLQLEGARNIITSMGAKGAVLITEDGEVFIAESLKGDVKNTVGAGDSMVAGFISGYYHMKNYEKAFALAVAAGTATAFSDTLAKGEEIKRLEKGINIQRL
ncbi:MAG: 1-phosphofructokinase [Tissierellia bacterium]|nr:1-phosphofructokinase [Tissierellia bacterium]